MGEVHVGVEERRQRLGNLRQLRLFGDDEQFAAGVFVVEDFGFFVFRPRVGFGLGVFEFGLQLLEFVEEVVVLLLEVLAVAAVCFVLFGVAENLRVSENRDVSEFDVAVRVFGLLLADFQFLDFAFVVFHDYEFLAALNNFLAVFFQIVGDELENEVDDVFVAEVELLKNVDSFVELKV